MKCLKQSGIAYSFLLKVANLSPAEGNDSDKGYEVPVIEPLVIRRENQAIFMSLASVLSL
jgi:hypothetical protein